MYAYVGMYITHACMYIIVLYVKSCTCMYVRIIVHVYVMCKLYVHMNKFNYAHTLVCNIVRMCNI